MDIAVAHKGYAWFEIETTGKRAHGSVPERGTDAIEKMAKIISQLDSIRSHHKTRKHPLVGTPRIHTSTITGGSDWSTVPAKCVLRLERRLIPGEDTREAVTELRNAVDRCIMHDSTLRAKVRMIHHADSMQVDANAPHITMLRKKVRQLCGRGKIVGVPYWTDASILVNQARIPSCLFGPGDISVAHGQEEYIEANDVLTASRIYAEAALDYCNRENYS
jgi:acetylornithine deacetylase/succinyl-diaminopimelate desuccinylase-like protein